MSRSTLYNDAPLNLLRTSCRKAAKSEWRDVAPRQAFQANPLNFWRPLHSFEEAFFMHPLP